MKKTVPVFSEKTVTIEQTFCAAIGNRTTEDQSSHCVSRFSVVKPNVFTFCFIVFLCAVCLIPSAVSQQLEWFVTTNGVGDGSSWINPTNSIQGAIDAAVVDAVIWVSNGLYDTGGVANYPPGQTLTNRIAIHKAVTVRAAGTNPADTIIKGSGGALGPAGVRCVYMTNGASLIGFTLMYGTTQTGWIPESYGGGVHAQHGGTVSNCVFLNNKCYGYGAGAYYGALYNCRFVANTSSVGGGGAAYANLYNCTLTNNYAGNTGGGVFSGTSHGCLFTHNRVNGVGGGGAYAGIHYNSLLIGNRGLRGGGSYGGVFYNCTSVGNLSYPYGTAVTNCGGGVYEGVHYNCVITFNNAESGIGSNWYGSAWFTNSCTIPAQPGWAAGNIAVSPVFIDSGNGYGLDHIAGDYRLYKFSPCINAGTNMSWMTNAWGVIDLDANPRIISGVVDMGAYEYDPPSHGTIFSLK